MRPAATLGGCAKIKSVQSLAISALMLAVCSAAHAQNWPDRPVKFISSQAAGGGTDMIGRLAGWWILAAPAGVPAPILQRINGEVAVILKDPAVVERLRNIGFISRGGGNMKETRDYVQAQHTAWGNLVKQIGLNPE